MARKARDKSTYGTYYIHQYGAKNKLLFSNDDDRLKFIEILSQNKIKFNFKVYAFCLNDQDSYHLIIFDNGSDISKIMKSINISYAMYMKCTGVLFKDRYKSHKINDLENFLNVTNTLKENSKASKWNTYCTDSTHGNNTFSLIDHLELSDIAFCHDQEKCIECTTEAKIKLEEECQRRGLSSDELIKNKQIRNDMIRFFRQNSTLSLKSLGNLFGGLSESSICKILNQIPKEPQS